MFLKKISSSGFKSFADKVTLVLDKRHITGIVGPNGSGKSNIIDAVRWVMGEQNAKMLRGEKATDIIFSGSERRKPLGMAEVSLVFDNEEASHFCPPEYRHEPEITLTRRLYLDGQREYLINRKPCRLKDIISFFTSTGLGGRSYSMIQQGQVDRILQAKPEQIREILEEAAGTAIFKKRKQEAFKKLETTKLNLSRIEDILKEVERQIEALKAQVEKAENWQKLNEELKTRELKLFAHSHSNFKDKELAVKGQLKDFSQQELLSLQALNDLELEQVALKQRLDEADPELNALNERITTVRESIASNEALLLSNIQLLESGHSQIESFDKDLFEEEKNFEKAQEAFQRAEETLEAVELEADQLQSFMDDFGQNLDLAEEEALVFQNKLEGLAEEKRNVDRLLESYQLKQENIEREYSKVARVKAEYTDRLMGLEDEYSQAQIHAESISLKQANFQKEIDEQLELKNQLELGIEQKRTQLQKLNSNLEETKGRFVEGKALLQALQEVERSGLDVASKVDTLRSIIKENRSSCECVLLTELIGFGVSFKEFPQEFVSSFEKWAERIVVHSWDHYEQLSEMVKDKSWGGLPASILLASLDTRAEISKWSQKYQLEPIHLYLNVEREYKGLEHVLDRLYLVSDTSRISTLIDDIPPGVVLFTKHGDIFSGSDDFIIGNAQGQGALSRKMKVEELESEQRLLSTQLELDEGNLSYLKEEEQADLLKLKEVDKLIFEQNKEALDIISDLRSLEQKVEHKRDLMIDIRRDYNKAEEQCEEFGLELSELKTSIATLEEEKIQTSDAYDDAKLQAEELKDQQEEMQKQYDQKKIDLAACQTKSSTIREHFDQDKQNIDQMKERLSRRRQEREALKERYDLATEERSRLEHEIATCISQREEWEQQLLAKRDTNTELVEELRRIEKDLKERQDSIRMSQKGMSEKEIELEKISLGLTSVIQQCEEKYHIDLPAYEFKRDHSFDSNAEAKLVSKIRQKIDSIGHVNMMAIEEFKELSERQTFIIAQKEEVVSSMDLLEIAIEEIEQNSKNKFMNTFNVLNKEFASLFPILFPRGEAQIQLTDEENVLESGVEIMVRLPGKNRQNMRLFSGGEKALTAIALIFALLKSKPTPFCFLDEVDAPLDETNVSRYNKVLETLADRFQFIVITHRRRTMEVLDTLYGVTMQEPGVSKVVGVDMNKALPVHLQKAFKDLPKTDQKSARKGASADL